MYFFQAIHFGYSFPHQVTGHMLTARSALSVALANKNIPSIKLLEVYRAPPRLVDAYNELSYEGQLVSRKVGISCFSYFQSLVYGFEISQQYQIHSISVTARGFLPSIRSWPCREGSTTITACGQSG